MRFPKRNIMTNLKNINKSIKYKQYDNQFKPHGLWYSLFGSWYKHIESNKENEIIRARGIGANFCIDFTEIDLTDEFKTLSSFDDHEEIENDDDMSYRIRKGNIKARIRMMYLYNVAQINKGLVLSTDNYTEYLLGFWTLHGDVGDFGMIQNLQLQFFLLLITELQMELEKII